jgi:hypothetical protein
MNNSSVPTIAALLLSAGLAQSVDPPPQKEGLWSVHRQSANNAGKGKSDLTETLCRNREYDKYVEDRAKNIPGCKVLNANFANGTHTVEMQCNVGNSVVDSKVTTTYKGDTELHSETNSTYTPPLMGMSEVNMVTDQKYVGSCPAGAQPGDVTHANGKTTNAWKH